MSPTVMAYPCHAHPWVNDEDLDQYVQQHCNHGVRRPAGSCGCPSSSWSSCPDSTAASAPCVLLRFVGTLLRRRWTRGHPTDSQRRARRAQPKATHDHAPTLVRMPGDICSRYLHVHALARTRPVVPPPSGLLRCLHVFKGKLQFWKQHMLALKIPSRITIGAVHTGDHCMPVSAGAQ